MTENGSVANAIQPSPDRPALFISWSGEPSGRVAEAFDTWIKKVVPGTTTWLSRKDIESGASSREEIATNLRSCRHGVSFVTSKTEDAAWINFEAGALFNSLADQKRVHVVLLDNVRIDEKKPMGSFQSTKTDSASMFKLVTAINKNSPSSQSDDNLRIVFDARWPDFEKVLQTYAEDSKKVGGTSAKSAPPTKEDEILERLAALERMLAPVTASLISSPSAPTIRVGGAWDWLNETQVPTVSSILNRTVVILEFPSARGRREFVHGLATPQDQLAIWAHKVGAPGHTKCGTIVDSSRFLALSGRDMNDTQLRLSDVTACGRCLTESSVTSTSEAKTK
jgi:hypothetical protein